MSASHSRPTGPPVSIIELNPASRIDQDAVVTHLRLSVFPAAKLPVPLSSLVGRRQELTDLRGLIVRRRVRLLTLTGAGGAGKTRLAVEAARDVAATFADGVAFVDLSSLTDHALVLPTIAQALGLRELPDLPAADTIAAALADRTLLLVLDNLERVTGAAPDLAALLGACPGLTMLVTSRVVLRVSGEHAFPVSPLPYPDPGDVLAGRPWSAAAEPPGAVALFVERARAADPGFALSAENAASVAAICARLDGLPLAIELAAVWAWLLSPSDLLVRLNERLLLLTNGVRDAPQRQRALRDAIAWSDDLLRPDEQAMFRRLSVFTGGFDLRAAGTVLGHEGEPGLDLLEGIGSLLDHSLLRRIERSGEDHRFGMLETIREFGLDRLAESGEAPATHDAHADFCLALAARPDPTRSAGAQDEQWLRRLEREHDNLRAALAWLAESGDGERLLRLTSALAWPWNRRGHLREGDAWLDRALGLAAAPRGDRIAAEVRLEALWEAGTLAWEVGDLPRSLARFEAARALAG